MVILLFQEVLDSPNKAKHRLPFQRFELCTVTDSLVSRPSLLGMTIFYPSCVISGDPLIVEEHKVQEKSMLEGGRVGETRV